MNQSIDDIIIEMNLVIDHCIKTKSKIGYFAVLYRDVTIEVRNKIKENYFEDNDRMERLDVIFANRFLDAIHQYWNNENTVNCWIAAFESSNKTILQHLLLGMNAHINYDLAIATVEVTKESGLLHIKNDFDKIMNILSNMIDSVQERIEIVSPYIKLIDYIGHRTDERIAQFSINKARDYAWNMAVTLSILPTNEFNNCCSMKDIYISYIAHIIAKPGILLSFCFHLIKMKECKDVEYVMNTLKKSLT